VFDDLHVILEAEAEARSRFEAARKEAADLVRQTEDEAQRQVRAAREAQQSDAAAVEARIVAEAEAQAARMLAAAEATAATMQAQAAAHLDVVVHAIIRAVLAPDGTADTRAEDALREPQREPALGHWIQNDGMSPVRPEEPPSRGGVSKGALAQKSTDPDGRGT